MDLKYGDAIKCTSKEEHYEIRKLLIDNGMSVQSIDGGWEYEDYPDIGFNNNDSDSLYNIVGWGENSAHNYLSKEVFLNRAGICSSSHSGSVLKFNFIKYEDV